MYNKTENIFEWDEAKRRANLEKHHIDFKEIAEFWESRQVVIEDLRFQYDEKRWTSYGLLKKRVMVVVYTRRQEVIRIISFRKANAREVSEYENAIKG